MLMLEKSKGRTAKQNLDTSLFQTSRLQKVPDPSYMASTSPKQSDWWMRSAPTSTRVPATTSG